MNTTKKVLIVDDNILNVKVAERLLESLNFEIEVCYDGNECLELIKSGKNYDLILMDIMMPNLDGLRTTEILKKEMLINTPIMAVTADATDGIREKCLEAGCIDYLSKPLYKDLLIDRVKYILNI